MLIACLGEALVTLRHALKARLQAKDLYLPLCCTKGLFLELVRPLEREAKRFGCRSETQFLGGQDLVLSHPLHQFSPLVNI